MWVIGLEKLCMMWVILLKTCFDVVKFVVRCVCVVAAEFNAFKAWPLFLLGSVPLAPFAHVQIRISVYIIVGEGNPYVTQPIIGMHGSDSCPHQNICSDQRMHLTNGM